MGVAARVERRGDRHSAGQVECGIDLVLACADNGFGVRSSQLAELVGELGQRSGVLHVEEQMLSAPRSGRENHVRSRVGAAVLSSECTGSLGEHVPRTVASLTKPGHGGHRNDLGAGCLGKAQIVLEERVLRSVTAARHALATLDATCALGSDAAEVRVLRLLARFTEVDADGRLDERVADTHVVGDRLHDLVGGRHVRILDDAEHLLSLLVVRRELAAPVGDVRPLLVLEERLRRLVQRVGVVQRPAADACARENEAVAQQVHALNAEAPQLRSPEELLEIPTGLREIFVGIPSAGFDDADLVALLHETKRAHASAEPGSDDQYVVVRCPLLAHQDTSTVNRSYPPVCTYPL